MSEQDFEMYLMLLAKTLRLSDKQRIAIASELRDHLEARLEELTAEGVGKHDAIKTALAEFGDASALANDFTAIAQHRNRRRIMQTTFGALVACTALFAAAFALLPTQRPTVQSMPEATASTPPPAPNGEAGPAAGDATDSRQLGFEFRFVFMSREAFPSDAPVLIDSPFTPAVQLDADATQSLIEDNAVTQFACPALTCPDRQPAMVMLAQQYAVLDEQTDSLIAVNDGLRIELQSAYREKDDTIAMAVSVLTQWAGHDTASPELRRPVGEDWLAGCTGTQLQLRIDNSATAAIMLPLGQAQLRILVEQSPIAADQALPEDAVAVLLVTAKTVDAEPVEPAEAR